MIASLLDPEPTPATQLGLEILTEFRALTTLLTPGLLVHVGIVFGVALVLRRGIAWLVKLVWNVGGDPRRHLARVKGILDFVIVTVSLIVALRPLFAAVPLILALVTATAGLIAAIALPEWIQNTAAGLALTARGQFREGDQIQVGTAAGGVDRIGLQRTRLRADDGSLISMPNRDILHNAVRVGGQQSAVPVTLVLPGSVVSSPADRARILEVARLSPFRRAGTSPHLEDRDDHVVLSLQTWATTEPGMVKQALRAAIATTTGARP